MDPLAFVFGNLVSPAPNTLTQEDRDGKAKAHASLPPRSAAAPAQDCDLPFDLDLDRLLQSTAAAVTVSPWTPTPSTCSTSTTTTSNNAGKDKAEGKSKSKSRNKNKWLCLANSFSNPSHNMTNSKNQQGHEQGQGQGQGHEQEQEQEREWDPILTAFLNDSALAQLPSISTCASSSPAVNANNLDLYLGLDPLGLDAIDAMDASVAASAGSSNTLNINGLFPPSPPHSVMSGSLSPQRNTDLDTPSPLAHPAVPPTSSPPPLTGGGVGDHNLAPSLPLSSFPATGFSWPPFSTSPFSNPAAASTDPNASAAAAAAAAAAAMSMSMMFPPTSVFPPAWMPPPTGTTPLTPPAGTDFSSFPKLFPSFWPPSTNATPALPLTASSTSGTSSSATLLPSPAASTTASRSVSPPTSAASPTPGNTGKSASRSKPAVKTAPSQKRTSSQAGNSTPSSLSSSSPTPSSDLDPMDIVTDDLTPAAREAQALLTSRPKRRRRSAGQHSATFDDDLPTDTLMGGTLLPRPGSDADPSAPVSDAATTQPSNLTPEEKKRIRMMKNRLAASESRKRHREHLDTLESTTHQLVAENARLVAALRDSQAQCAELAGQVAKLTATLELAQQDSKVKSFGAVFALAMVGAAWLVPVMFTSPVPPGVGLVVRPGVRDPVQSGGSAWSAPVRGVKWNDGGQVLRTLGGKWHVGDPGAEIVPAAKHAGTLAGRVRAAARAVQWSITGKHAHEVPRLPEGPSSSAGLAAEAEATKVQQQDVRVQAKPWASGAVALIDAATAAGREQEDGVRPFVVVDGLVDEEDDVVEGPQVPVLQTLVNERADQ